MSISNLAYIINYNGKNLVSLIKKMYCIWSVKGGKKNKCNTDVRNDEERWLQTHYDSVDASKKAT